MRHSNSTEQRAPTEDAALNFETVLREEEKKRGICSNTRQDAPAGLALSGGGIRSATFSLGVLQALAAEKKLASFDYLSTVSGGGYIGAWLTAWIHRSGFSAVEAALAARGSGNARMPGSTEPEPLSWLRRYSNYLAPRAGLFSSDSLTLVTTWSRNVLLNLIIVIAFFSALMLIPRLALPCVGLLTWIHPDEMGVLAASAGMLSTLAVLWNFLLIDRPPGDDPGRTRCRLCARRGVALTVFFPGIVAAIAGSIWLWGRKEAFENDVWGFALHAPLLLLPAWLIWLAVELWRAFHAAAYRSAPWERVNTLARHAGILALAGIISSAIGAGMLACVHHGFVFRAALGGSTHGPYAFLFTIGPAAFLAIFGVAGSIYVGLAGRVYREQLREWWSRMNAAFLVIAAAWLSLTACAFYIPALAEWAYASSGPWLRSAIGASWLATLAGMLLAPKNTWLTRRAQEHMRIVLNAAAIVFMLGFVIAVSVATEALLSTAGNIARTPVASRVESSDINPRASGYTGPGAFIAARQTDLDQLLNLNKDKALPFLEGAFIVTLAVLLIFGWRVDVNRFSLHNLYKTRLIRCYLGASNAKRHAQPFTGFDENDDLPLAALAPEGEKLAQRPFHIINAALNISQGKNLAWQERKAASFVLTPLHSGFELAKTQGETTEKHARQMFSATQADGLQRNNEPEWPAYRPTRQYACLDQEDRAFSLGMAIATSGAAASPNMGYNTNPALAFVLTLFNVRIGRWSPNPARDKWKRASPGFGLICLLQELFGFSNEQSNFVYLSDGGHFDNMGIYELVRRRCKVIWLVDAAADAQRGFEDLGRAIRLCRIDFGVEIIIDLNDMRPAQEKELPCAAFAKGVIDYSAGETGTIIYIKPTLCHGKREPIDVLNYSVKNPSFPQQSPGDQFFDESQFESYRCLGEHIAEQCLCKHRDTLP